ncbi:MAG: sigma-54 dependent transcriptional regulator [Cytophagales bacterium]|nr:sigma-54 dependent transcriptional regulator [Cytophagales bacterium]
MFKIFIVEDDPWYGELLKYHLSLNPDYDIDLFTTANDCLINLYQNPDVICMDFGLPDMTGDKLLEKIKARNPSASVVVISGQEEISVAVNLLKSGATDYIVKDDNSKDLLWNSILKIRENSELKQRVEDLEEQLVEKFEFENAIIGQSEGIKRTFSLIEKATRKNINVSISGETGTGKEVVARAIHYHGERKKKPFVAVNLAAIPKELLESEMFGHEKGAFTGAVSKKIGKFEEAQGGTIFLDEVAELDLNLQSKLLRVLQEREVVRVGGSEVIELDVRLITATHKNLAEEVEKNNFREDLFYRIIGLPIRLPPLRDRGSDILILARHFADEFARTNGMGSVHFSDDAKNKLLKYHYPGNVRELKAVVDLACVMCEAEEISGSDITFTAVKSRQNFMAEDKTLRAYTCDIIEHFLEKHNNNVVEVAQKLGIGKSKIYNMIQNKEISFNKR